MAMHAKIYHLSCIPAESSTRVLQLPIRKAKYELTLKEPGAGDIIGKLQVQAQVRPGPHASSQSCSSDMACIAVRGTLSHPVRSMRLPANMVS